MTIRRCADAALLAAIDADEPDRWSTGSYAATLASDATLALVDDERAFALCSIAADEAELLRIVVARAARRRGIGRALLDACRTSLVGRSVARAFLEVRVDNGAARALYEGAGWLEVGRRRGYYADGTDAVVMRLDLAGLTGPRGS